MVQALYYGKTPLHLAAQKGDLQAAESLLKKGADINARDEFGNAPLFDAVFNSRNSGDMISLLLKHGADPLAANHSGVSPASLARKMGSENIVALFKDVPEGPSHPPPNARPALYPGDLIPIPAGKYDWKKEIYRLFLLLVPVSGQAPTVQGEVIRAIMKITDEVYRNGGANWDGGFKRLAEYAGEVLNDEKIFTFDDRKAIVHAVSEILRFKSDLTGDGKPCYLLSEFAVRWCFANPKLIARNLDLKLKR